MAFDDLPDVAPLVGPVVDALQKASRRFGDEPFSTTLWVANVGDSLQTDIQRPDLDPLFGDSGHMQMELMRHALLVDAATTPLMDALKTWGAQLGGHPPLGFSLALGVCSQEGAWGLVRPGFHPLNTMLPLDDMCHNVPQGFFVRALRVAATLGNTQSGAVWSLRDTMQDKPVQVYAATAEEAFALLGAYHAPELWMDPRSSRWDLAQHHANIAHLASSMERFG